MLHKLARNNKAQNGLVMCGQPLDNTATLSEQPPGAIQLDMQFSLRNYCKTQSDKTRNNFEKCKAMALFPERDTPTIQLANIMTRERFAVRYQHLARVLPTPMTTNWCADMGPSHHGSMDQPQVNHTTEPDTSTPNTPTNKAGMIWSPQLLQHRPSGTYHNMGIF